MEETWIQKKELVYALDNPVFDNAFIDAHDLIVSYVRHNADRFETMIFNRIETLSKISTVKHCSGSWRITSLTHHIMRMISYARHDVGGFFIASFPGVVH